jgi:hypothetical protein
MANKRMMIFSGFFTIATISFVFAGPAGTNELKAIFELAKKHDAPPLPDVVGKLDAWYQLFIVPETVTDNAYPVIVTLQIMLDSSQDPLSGHLQVHAKKNNSTIMVGELRLSNTEAANLTEKIGKSEAFSLPCLANTVEYEHRPHFGGDRHILVRRDHKSTYFVSRRDWESEPVMMASREITRHIQKFFDTSKKKK